MREAGRIAHGNTLRKSHRKSCIEGVASRRRIKGSNRKTRDMLVSVLASNDASLSPQLDDDIGGTESKEPSRSLRSV